MPILKFSSRVHLMIIRKQGKQAIGVAGTDTPLVTAAVRIDQALRHGYRGLPSHVTIAKVLAQYRGGGVGRLMVDG